MTAPSDEEEESEPEEEEEDKDGVLDLKKYEEILARYGQATTPESSDIEPSDDEPSPQPREVLNLLFIYFIVIYL